MQSYVSACPAAETAIVESAEGESRSWGGACHRGKQERACMRQIWIVSWTWTNMKKVSSKRCWNADTCVTSVSHVCDVTYVYICLMQQLCQTCLTVGDQCEHVNMCRCTSTHVNVLQHIAASAGLSTGGCLPKLRSDFAGKLLAWTTNSMLTWTLRSHVFSVPDKGFNVFSIYSEHERLRRDGKSISFCDQW